MRWHDEGHRASLQNLSMIDVANQVHMKCTRALFMCHTHGFCVGVREPERKCAAARGYIV